MPNIKLINKIMKKLHLNQMENLSGGLIPSKQQVTCYVASTILGLCNPLVGIIAGGICLFMD